MSQVIVITRDKMKLFWCITVSAPLKLQHLLLFFWNAKFLTPRNFTCQKRSLRSVKKENLPPRDYVLIFGSIFAVYHRD